MGCVLIKRWVSSVVLAVFVQVNVVSPACAQDSLTLPLPGQMVSLSPAFNPPVLKGIRIYPDDPLRFDFILDPGDSGSPAVAGQSPAQQKEGKELLEEQNKVDAIRLIKYFLASLTIPEKDLWVNLSPYEPDRIVPEAFGRTEMGRSMLAQDYLLKQITASLLYPEGTTGKMFWQKIYALAQEKYGTTDIPLDTFNKVWIVPEMAKVYENGQAGAAYITGSRLKVMIEQDYLGRQKTAFKPSFAQTAEERRVADIANDVLREVIIPVLEGEVNSGSHFAVLRQVYQSLILATWYKKKVRRSLLSAVYVDQNKTAGMAVADLAEAEKIWGRYVQAFKTGVYDYVKEARDVVTSEIIPRKYFSGGWTGIVPLVIDSTVDNSMLAQRGLGKIGVHLSAVDASMSEPVLVTPLYTESGRNTDLVALLKDRRFAALTGWDISRSRQVVDIGVGYPPVTTIELKEQLAAASPLVHVSGMELPAAVSRRQGSLNSGQIFAEAKALYRRSKALDLFRAMGFNAPVILETLVNFGYLNPDYEVREDFQGLHSDFRTAFPELFSDHFDKLEILIRYLRDQIREITFLVTDAGNEAHRGISDMIVKTERHHSPGKFYWDDYKSPGMDVLHRQSIMSSDSRDYRHVASMFSRLFGDLDRRGFFAPLAGTKDWEGNYRGGVWQTAPLQRLLAANGIDLIETNDLSGHGNKFDLVTASHMTMHLTPEMRAEFVRQMTAVLKERGVLVVKNEDRALGVARLDVYRRQQGVLVCLGSVVSGVNDKIIKNEDGFAEFYSASAVIFPTLIPGALKYLFAGVQESLQTPDPAEGTNDIESASAGEKWINDPGIRDISRTGLGKILTTATDSPAGVLADFEIAGQAYFWETVHAVLERSGLIVQGATEEKTGCRWVKLDLSKAAAFGPALESSFPGITEKLRGSQLEKLRSYPGQYYLHNGEINIPHRWWQNVNTSFEVIDTQFNLKETIRQVYVARTNKRDPINILDWGGGSGRAAEGLHWELTRLGIPHHIYVLSHDYLLNFEDGPQEVSYILDDAGNLKRYISPGSLDIIYSHLGINHFMDNTDYRDQDKDVAGHFRDLISLLSPQGIIRLGTRFDSILAQLKLGRAERVSGPPAGRYYFDYRNKVGGIDLDPETMDLQISADGAGGASGFDPAMFRQVQDAAGFDPVIIGIQPEADLKQFLGLQGARHL